MAITVQRLSASLLTLCGALNCHALTWSETKRSYSAHEDQDFVDFVFSVFNQRESAVKIVSVTPNCDCITLLDAAPFSLAPNSKRDLRARMDIRGKNGILRRNLTVVSNEKANDVTVLEVEVEARGSFAIDKRSVTWKVGESPGEKALKIAFTPGIEHSLDRVTAQGDVMNVRYEPTGEAGGYVVHVTPRSTATIAQSTIRIDATVNGNRRSLVIPAMVK